MGASPAAQIRSGGPESARWRLAWPAVAAFMQPSSAIERLTGGRRRLGVRTPTPGTAAASCPFGLATAAPWCRCRRLSYTAPPPVQCATAKSHRLLPHWARRRRRLAEPSPVPARALHCRRRRLAPSAAHRAPWPALQRRLSYAASVCARPAVCPLRRACRRLASARARRAPVLGWLLVIGRRLRGCLVPPRAAVES